MSDTPTIAPVSLVPQRPEQVAGAPAPAPQQPQPGGGAQQLTEASIKALTGAHDLVITNIDEMIATLMSLKESIKAKRDATATSVQDFVNTVGTSLDGLKTLQSSVDKVVKNHL